MKKHSFKKSGTNFYKKRAGGGGSKAIYKIYKKTDKLAPKSVPKWLTDWLHISIDMTDATLVGDDT